MATGTKGERKTFGLSKATLTIWSILGVIFFAGGVADIVKSRPPTLFLLFLPLVLFLSAAAVRVRLIVDQNGIFVRKLIGNWQSEYCEISEVYITSLSSANSPIGLPILNLQTNKGLKKINLHLFSTEAYATLFSALEEKGIKIRKLNTVMCRWIVKDIRYAQKKMKAKNEFPSGEKPSCDGC